MCRSEVSDRLCNVVTMGDNACDHKDRGAPLPNFGVVYLHCCLLGAVVLGEGY